MAKLYAVIHPANPKVGDEVTILDVEVESDEAAQRLAGFTWPAAAFVR